LSLKEREREKAGTIKERERERGRRATDLVVSVCGFAFCLK